MKLNRLFEMVYLLMEREDITASMLAKRFEVSTRTVYRDVEVLSQAGVPIYTSKGKGGGIRLLPDFVLNKSLLSEGEQNEILYALQGLAATGIAQDTQVLSRLNAFFKREQVDWIDVDFSRWGSTSREKEKFMMLKEGILNHRVVTFVYASSSGENTLRRVEPVKLRFKNYDWYLQGYSLEREAFRTFKISRMEQVTLSDEPAKLRQAPPADLDGELTNTAETACLLKLHFTPQMAFRIWDEFEPNSIQRQKDGSFLVFAKYQPSDHWMLSHLLSFGNALEVLSPPEVRRLLGEESARIAKKYAQEPGESECGQK